MNTEVMFSSETEEWATPQYFFDMLDHEFGFTLDPCSTNENAKCEKYYTKNENGIKQDWSGEIVFVNPPYGRYTTPVWVEKCYLESKKNNTVVVALLPARTCTIWFHKYIYGHVKEIRFIKGRIKFGGARHGAPFPSMVIVF